jgi:hypothetical protein
VPRRPYVSQRAPQKQTHPGHASGPSNSAPFLRAGIRRYDLPGVRGFVFNFISPQIHWSCPAPKKKPSPLVTGTCNFVDRSSFSLLAINSSTPKTTTTTTRTHLFLFPNFITQLIHSFLAASSFLPRFSFCHMGQEVALEVFEELQNTDSK